MSFDPGRDYSRELEEGAMEKSALVYIGLIVITTGLALLVQNEEYSSFQRFGSIGTGYRPMDRRQARNIVVMWGIYLLLAGVSACRIAVGNDYWVYRENFKLIAQERHVSSEIGFNLVVKGLVRIFGYDNYLPVFGFFSLVTVLFFVLALRDQGSHFAFSLFLLLTEGFYFNSLNTVRYYLALSMALFSMIYVLRREYGKFLLVILAGALFHKSILLVIPVYLAADFLARLKWKRAYGIAAAVLGGVFVSSLFWGKGLYRWIIFRIYPFYENSHFDQSRISYKNLAIVLGTLALCFVTWLVRRRSGAPGQEISKDRVCALKFYGILNVFGLIAFCCGGFVPEVTRIGYYMTVSQVFLIPGLLSVIDQKQLKKVCYVGCLTVFALHFVLLLKQMYQVDVRLLPYRNWIFQ